MADCPNISAGGDGQKDRHLKLAGVVKSVHAKLRKHYRQSQDHKQVWKEHCQDNDLLLEYADAMHRLATEIWTKHPETRIDWCRTVCGEYFLGGGLQKVFEKEERRKVHLLKTTEDNGNTHSNAQVKQHQRSKSAERHVNCGNNTPNMNKLSASANQIHDYSKLNRLWSQHTDNSHPTCSIVETREGSRSPLGSSILDESPPPERDHCCEMHKSRPLTCCAHVNTTTSDFMASPSHSSVQSVSEAASVQNCESEFIFGPPDGMESDMCGRHGHIIQRKFNAITLPFEGQIRLLDVGSCYNAFHEFEEFQAIGIDISPAVESVYYCDFLHLDILEPLQLAVDSIGTFLHNLKSPVESLPSETFHVIVFSLLLEYFPSTYQRWICCQKAHELLAVNGMLIIITPDSHHQNKNAPMIKSWKTVIESLGFIRWRYVKLEHLHCMVFRKIMMKEAPSLIGEIKPDMLYIPQDFHYDDGDEVDNPFLFDSGPQTQDDMSWLKSNFEELPDFDDSD